MNAVYQYGPGGQMCVELLTGLQMRAAESSHSPVPAT